ncbi:MAG: hypothetical protein RL292_55 [Candidatus Parcubacteria bacterium]|jgi:hypothetical protein
MRVSRFYQVSAVLWTLVVAGSWVFFSRPLVSASVLGAVFVLLLILAFNQTLGVLVTYRNYQQGLQKWKITLGVPGFVGIYMTCVTLGAVLAHYFPHI